MPPLEITRGAKRSPAVSVKMNASGEFKLSDELRFELLVSVIDVESQAVQLDAHAVFAAGGSDGAQRTTIFRGPYSSGAIGDRIEAALIVGAGSGAGRHERFPQPRRRGIGMMEAVVVEDVLASSTTIRGKS